MIITGTLTDVCHAGAAEAWLRREDIQDKELLAALPMQNLKAMLPATKTACYGEMESAAKTNDWLRSDLDNNKTDASANR